MHPVLTALVTAGLLLAGCGGVVSAQPPKDRDNSRERLEIVTMWKLMEALDLDKATADRVFEIRRKFVLQKGVLEKDLRQDIEALRGKLREEPAKTDDAELSRLVKSVREKRKKLQGLQDEQYDEVSKILTLRQQAQMVVFFKDFHREIRAMLHPEGRPEGQGPLSEMGRRPAGEGPPPFGPGPGPRPPRGTPPGPP